METDILFLAAGAMLIVSLLIALGVARLGFPSLVAFLGLGMLLGTDGPGNIDFSNDEVARVIGTIGLVVILFEGGLSTSWRRLREVALPASMLSSVGVVLTAVLTGAVAYYILDLPLIQSMLIGAVVSSTDAAAVFASLRASKIKRKLARTLEAESGINDPMAIALTLGLIAWAHVPGYDIGNMSLLLVEQLSIGLLFGAIFGFLAVNILRRLPKSIGTFAPVASVAICSLTFGVAQVAGGSGFLAVYIVGLAIGSTPSRYRSQLTSFHEGLAFLAQVIMFVTLGLFVNPKDLFGVVGAGILLALLLALLIRPLSVWISLVPFGYSRREKAFLGVAGLRGAVPIVLGTFVLSSGIEGASTIFNIVFFVVLVSALFQGAILEKIATRMGLLDHISQIPVPIIDPNKRVSFSFTVNEWHAIVGSRIKELGLPKRAHISSIVRQGKSLKPTSDIHILSGDVVKVAFIESARAEVEDATIRWRRRI